MHVLRKTGKIFLYTILFLVLILGLSSLLIDPLAKMLLEKKVDKAAAGQYDLEVQEVDISLLSSSFVLKGIRFKTDSSMVERSPVILAEIEAMGAKGVSWLTYLLLDKLVVDQIFLSDMALEVKTHAIQNKDTSKQSPFRIDQLKVYDLIKGKVDRVHLKDLSVNRINFEIINLSTRDTLQFQSEKLNIQSNDILLDADKIFTDARAFYAARINLDGKDISIIRKGNVRAESQAEKIRFDTRDDQLSIRVEGVQHLQQKVSQEDTLLFGSLDTFALRKLDLQKVQEEEKGHINKILLKQAEIINNMSTQSDQNKNSSVNLARWSLGDKLPGTMKSLHLDSLVIADISYTQEKNIRMRGGDLQMYEIIVDRHSAFAGEKLMHASRLKSSMAYLSYQKHPSNLSVTLQNFESHFDKGVGAMSLDNFQAQKGAKQQESRLVHVDTGPFQVYNINVGELENRKLSIDSIAIQRPEVRIQNSAEKSRALGSSSKRSVLSLYPSIKSVLDTLSIHKLAVISGEVVVTGMGRNNKSVHIPTLYLQIKNILIAPGTAFADNRVMHAENIALRLEDISYTLPTNRYTARLDLFRLSTYEQFLEAKNFRYKYSSPARQVLNNSRKSSLYEINSQSFRIEGLSYQQLLQRRAFFAHELKARGLDIFMYTDHTQQSQGSGQKMGMPQNLIKSIKHPFHIASIAVENAGIRYEELIPGADTTGMIQVTDLSLLAENFTNVDKILKKKPQIPVQINGLLMGSETFQTQLAVHMLSDSGKITFKGHLDTLDVTKLNRLTRYTSPLVFESGVFYELQWDVEADRQKATGTLAMRYDELAIQLQDKGPQASAGLLKDVGSYLINNLVLESDIAPKSSKAPVVAEISEEREQKDFPAYIRQALVEGFLEIMVSIY